MEVMQYIAPRAQLQNYEALLFAQHDTITENKKHVHKT